MVEVITNEQNKLLYASNKITILQNIELKKEVFLATGPIFFVHIPKTGGSSIDYLMNAICGLKGFKYISALASHIMQKDDLGGLSQIKKNLDLCNLENDNKTQFIYGHLPFPEQNYFNTDLISYFTVVRHPLKRVLSSLNCAYQRNLIKEDELEDVALNRDLDNLETRIIAGESFMKGDCTEGTYNQAVKNIKEKFMIVAPNEDVDIVMSLIAKRYEVENFAYARAQITEFKIAREDNKELSDKIIERNPYDIRLYEYVKDHWKSWKEEYIESISTNIADDKDYVVMTSEFYEKQVLYSSTLEQIRNYELLNEGELIGVTQNI